jgi:hypothetical protein
MLPAISMEYDLNGALTGFTQGMVPFWGTSLHHDLLKIRFANMRNYAFH